MDRANASVVTISAARNLLVGMFGLLSGLSLEVAAAAEYVLPRETTSFDCSRLSPGDSVLLNSGDRGPLTISNCAGTASKPITFRNDPKGSGPTVIQRSSGVAGGFVLECRNCVGVAIDGSSKWSGAPSGVTYGIKVTMVSGGAPAVFVMVSGASSHVTIRNVEIDGKWPLLANNGIGIHVKDSTRRYSTTPSARIDGILIENTFVHDIEGEALYIGPNWYEDRTPLSNILIRNNRIEDIGWEGIQLKSAVNGTNKIEGNLIRRIGQRSDDKSKGQLWGISMLDGNGVIAGNWVENAGDAGIQHYIVDLPTSFGAQLSQIYNNVVVYPGRIGLLKGHGISVGNNSGFAPPKANIYSNTIIGAPASGISVGGQTSGGFVRDNIVAGSGEKAIIAPSVVTTSNNRVGSVADMMFVDVGARNYRLRSTSPARNAGGSAFPAADFDGIQRPKEGVADQGAFEYSEGDETKPEPPSIIVIE